jgi:SAM-dependent methyltransferase
MSAATRDPWLSRWLALIGERAAGEPILELGCGGGRDSALLVAAGHRVVGVDLSAKAIANARQRAPVAEFHCQDIQAPFPMARAGVVIASLSLHYFPWAQTEELVGRIREVLAPSGLLVCRLNSTNDHHFGASGHPRIDDDDGFYLVDGSPKRFFDRPAVTRLFANGWGMLSLEEGAIDRYDHPKWVWETILERIG